METSRQAWPGRAGPRRPNAHRRGAQQAMQQIEAAVEPTLAGDGELAPLADWGAKYVGAIARIAGILHLAQHGPAGARKEVAAGTVKAAVRIGEYFKACAINAFTEMGEIPSLPTRSTCWSGSGTSGKTKCPCATCSTPSAGAGSRRCRT